MKTFHSATGFCFLCLACLIAPAAQSQTVLVRPYVQPGDGRTLSGTDVKTIVWLTDQTSGDFVVEFGERDGQTRTVRPTRIALDFLAPKIEKKPAGAEVLDAAQRLVRQILEHAEKDQHYFKYTAHLDKLPFDADIVYRVKLANALVREAAFRTRASAAHSFRCVLVGDLAQGRAIQKEVAYQISLTRPDCLLALGDMVYPNGRVSQYMDHFWTTYNDVPVAGPTTGAPLMASVPFYAVLGNHDISAKLPAVSDAFGAYYFFMPPKGGPGEGKWTTPLGHDEDVAARFRKAAADSYPNLDAYSFDYGPAHFVAINNNGTIDNTSAEFRRWLLEDLKSSKAVWKFVCFHVPGFQSAKQHYSEQQARLLQPIFEEGGVNLTFAGHVHNYQRTVPLRFVPQGKRAKTGKVNGKFTLDREFDGVENTRPSGIIHIVAGGGGAGLYGPGLDKTAAPLQKEHGANYANYTARMIADRHTFVALTVAPTRLELTAFASNGEEMDRIVVTK